MKSTETNWLVNPELIFRLSLWRSFNGNKTKTEIKLFGKPSHVCNRKTCLFIYNITENENNFAIFYCDGISYRLINFLIGEYRTYKYLLCNKINFVAVCFLPTANMCSAINTKTRIILLSCGSFNPITHMHLRLFGELNISVF